MDRQRPGARIPSCSRRPIRELTFPAAEGDQGAESNTYYVAGRLRGRATQREWAFLVIFTFNNVRQRLRADFYTFALFDLATGAYGTYSEYDLPRPPRIRRRYKLSVARRPSRRRVRLGARHQPLDDAARRRRRAAAVRLRAQPGRPRRRRAPHGASSSSSTRRSRRCRSAAPQYAGVKTCMGQYGTHSYFQSDVRFRGTLEWGDVREEVDGRLGLDRPAVDAAPPRRALRPPQQPAIATSGARSISTTASR